MLLWKMSPSPTVRTEIMSRPQPKVRRVPQKIKKVSRTSQCDFAVRADLRNYRECCRDEENYFFKLVLMMLLVLVLPATLMLLYIYFNPEAFQYDITPKQDRSPWHLGKSL